jgi:hypothetical protein
MAEAAISEASIRAALTERLKATYVEIQDMSGTAQIPRNLCPDVIPGRQRQQAAPPSSTLFLFTCKAALFMLAKS